MDVDEGKGLGNVREDAACANKQTDKIERNGKSQGQSLGDVLLGLYDCLSDPSKTRQFMAAVGSWLLDNPHAIPEFEKHSEGIWELIRIRAQAAPQQAPLDPVYFLAQDLRTLGAVDGFDLRARLHWEDERRILEWIKSGNMKPQAVRLYTDEAGADIQNKSHPGSQEDAQGPRLALLQRPAADQPGTPHGAIAVLEIVDPSLSEVMKGMLADTFGLTPKQIDVLGALAQGAKPQDIADQQQVKVSTIRSHIKDMGRAMGTSSREEIIADLRAIEVRLATAAPRARPVINGSTLNMPNGQQVSFRSYGPKTGKPVLYIHGFLAGRNLPPSVEKTLKGQNICLIAPNRPGVGDTTPAPGSCEKAYLQQTIDMLAHLSAALNLPAQGPTPLIADGTGLIYALEYARRHPERCGPVMALNPLPPVLDINDLDKFTGLFHKGMTTNLASREMMQALLYMVYEETAELQSAEEFAENHYFQGTSAGKAQAPKEDWEARWANVQENLAGKFTHLIFDCDLIKTDYATFPAGSNQRPPIHVFQTDDSPYLAPGAAQDFAETIEAPFEHAGATAPYVAGQLPQLLTRLRSHM